MRTFFKGTAVGAAAAASPAIWSEAKAQARNETLLIVGESPPNSMDIHGVGANRPAYEVSWNTHDRLMTYGVKKDANGNDHYDYTKLEPELATEWDLKPNSVTFKLRKDAKFHDGTPITAKDVKWSFDRAVTVGGFPTFQMAAGSLQKPEQFVAVDDNTFRVDFIRDDKLTMPDIGVPVPVIMNSELCKKNATAADPWAIEWCKNRPCLGRRLQGRALAAGAGGRLCAQRRLEDFVVEDGTVAHQPVVAMAGVGIERHIAKHADLGYRSS